MLLSNQKGFSPIILILIVLLLFAVAATGFFIYQKSAHKGSPPKNSSASLTNKSEKEEPKEASISSETINQNDLKIQETGNFSLSLPTNYSIENKNQMTILKKDGKEVWLMLYAETSPQNKNSDFDEFGEAYIKNQCLAGSSQSCKITRREKYRVDDRQGFVINADWIHEAAGKPKEQKEVGPFFVFDIPKYLKNDPNTNLRALVVEPYGFVNQGKLDDTDIKLILDSLKFKPAPNSQ